MADYLNSFYPNRVSYFRLYERGEGASLKKIRNSNECLVTLTKGFYVSIDKDLVII